jgi:hypothetical protein
MARLIGYLAKLVLLCHSLVSTKLFFSTMEYLTVTIWWTTAIIKALFLLWVLPRFPITCTHIYPHFLIFPPNNYGDCVDEWVRQCTSDYKINTTDLNSHSGAHLMHYLIPGFFVNRPIRCNNRTFLPSFTWSLQRVKINTHKTSPKLQCAGLWVGFGWVGGWVRMPTQQFFSYIIAKRWWWGRLCTGPTRLVGFF